MDGNWVFEKVIPDEEGNVTIPHDRYESMKNALLTVAVLGVMDENHAPELKEALDYARKASSKSLGWERKEDD